MADYRTMFDKNHIGAWDLNGKECTVIIEDVKAGSVGHGKKTDRKPIVRMRGKKKTWLLNVTNARAIAAMYGNDTRAWVGKAVTIYPTMADFGGKPVDAIRVRPGIPNGRGADLVERDPDPEMRARQNEAAAAAGQREPGDDSDEITDDEAGR